jgi:hypothetical protein
MHPLLVAALCAASFYAGMIAMAIAAAAKRADAAPRTR